MRRRISVAIVAMVVAALVLAGFSALVATVRHARSEARTELVSQAAGLARAVHREADAGHKDPGASLRTILRALKGPLRFEGEAVVGITADGLLFNPANPNIAPQLPTGLRLATIRPQALLTGASVSGDYSKGVFAAVPYDTPIQVGNSQQEVELVVVLTRSPPTGLAAGGTWFLVSAVIIVILSLVVANRLGHRFVRPLEAAQAVTGRIAGGDLTARVEEPAKADPELASLARSINVMAENLARSQGAEREFLLSVSHELRTPLTAVRGFAEAIEDGAADPGQAAGVIAAEARRLERLVGDLLDLAKLSARAFSLVPVEVRLDSAVEDAVAGFVPEAARLGVGLHLDAPSAAGVDLVVRTDPDRFAQVLANLTENALSFASSHVRVGFDVRRPEGEDPAVVCWVDDDGPGIAPADLDRVFERLFTSRPRGDRRVGSGLGLSIVAELVAVMGGSVRAESPISPGGGGTRIVVTLPA